MEILTLDEYFGNKPSLYPEDFTEEIEVNALELVARVNNLLSVIPQLYFRYNGINSGWRPVAYNRMVRNASLRSKHITAQAVDIADKGNNLDDFLFSNIEALEEADLYAEHPDDTPGWCHLQTVPPRSGRRIFKP